MSCMEIYAFNKEGDAVYYDDARNSWGGAMHIWNALSHKYGLGDFPMMSDKKPVPIWEACNKGELSELDTICVKFTYDNVWVKKENLPKLIEALEAFVKEHVDGKNIVRTLPAAIGIMKTIYEDDEMVGLAINATSVGEAWCGEIPLPCPECGCTCSWDDTRPYNLNKDSKHWELFEDKDKSDG